MYIETLIDIIPRGMYVELIDFRNKLGCVFNCTNRSKIYNKIVNFIKPCPKKMTIIFIPKNSFYFFNELKPISNTIICIVNADEKKYYNYSWSLLPQFQECLKIHQKINKKNEKQCIKHVWSSIDDWSLLITKKILTYYQYKTKIISNDRYREFDENYLDIHTKLYSLVTNFYLMYEHYDFKNKIILQKINLSGSDLNIISKKSLYFKNNKITYHNKVLCIKKPVNTKIMKNIILYIKKIISLFLIMKYLHISKKKKNFTFS